MKYLLVIAMTLAYLPRERVKEVHFDRIELNHYYFDGHDGSIHTLDQLIFWRWSRVEKRMQSFGFRVIKDGRDENGRWVGSMSLPRKVGNQYILKTQDHLIVGKTMIESHTSFDPERRDLDLYPESQYPREW